MKNIRIPRKLKKEVKAFFGIPKNNRKVVVVKKSFRNNFGNYSATIRRKTATPKK
jgi:hypothetical protein